ncbi:MAG: chorismate mutase [Pararhodobacter sp.]|nr:chorismate mutase [Pararhodobacter sp.]
MAGLRAIIDDLDGQLLDLLARRVACVDCAIVLKPGEGIPARAEDRVRAVKARVREGSAARGLDPALAEALWDVLIEWSIAREERVLGKEA